MRRIVTRSYSQRTSLMLEQSGVHPVLSRIYAARGIEKAEQLGTGLGDLLPPSGLTNANLAATLLAGLLLQEARLLIVADYDCDGATACAVGLKGLRALAAACGRTAHVDFLVPDRF